MENIIIKPIIRNALNEDLGLGDITTFATVSYGTSGCAALYARENLVLAGVDVFKAVFHEIDSSLIILGDYKDGDMIFKDSLVLTIEGKLQSILQAERTALNFLQRMSGIASRTKEYVTKVKPWNTKILDTRKTAPGIRVFDKYSVRVGGGYNHRTGLFDGVLIKDNHIIAAGGISKAVKKAKSYIPHTLKIEVEVETIDQLAEALDAGADIIMLDNMSVETMKNAVKIVANRVPLEASGGINLDNIAEIAATGVDFISVGDITHSVKAANFSLKIITTKTTI